MPPAKRESSRRKSNGVRSRGTRKKPSDGLAKGHEAEKLVAEIESTQESLRDAARAAMGVTGEGTIDALRAVVKRSGVGFYPLLALGVLLVVSEFQTYAFVILGPEVARALGLSKSAIAGVLALKTLAISVTALPMAAYVQRRPRRGSLAIATGFGWAAMTLLTGFATSTLVLAIILVADGASTASVSSIHPSLLMDTYPPEIRVRVLSLYRGARELGAVVGPFLVALLTGLLGFTWRGVFLISGVIALVAAVFAIRLRDPGFGRWDEARLREIVRARTQGSGPEKDEEDSVELGFFEIVRRILLIKTVKRILTAFAVVGMLLIPLTTYVVFFLERRWGLSPSARALFFAAVGVVAFPALAVFGKRGEALFQTSPSRLVSDVTLLLLGGVILMTVSIAMPVFGLMFVFFAAAFACFTCMGPGLSILLLGLVPTRMRPHAAALIGIFLAGVGGFAGLALLSGIDRRFGVGGAIVSLVVPGIAAALVLRGARKTVDQDLDRLVRSLVEDEELRQIASSGRHLPLLVCRHIDFSYGQLQVLFDVSFSVEDGEMVALLGTNGAGKSTLLRAISGLGLPDSGSIRLKGTNITYLDAERRVGLGIVQIPGGRSVFRPLTVVENLRLFAFRLGKSREAVDRAIDAAFEAFPALASRRNQVASTLSGGEQQMLGLGQAFLLRPRILLVDELSLGLAPKIVGNLLEMVRQINVSGTAVVLVEQSVNIALSLVEHAYFMEKGEIRFDGAARDLLNRPDLLRSVFLKGAQRGFLAMTAD